MTLKVTDSKTRSAIQATAALLVNELTNGQAIIHYSKRRLTAWV